MKKIILIGLLCTSFSGFAQSDPQKIIDQFFNLYKNKNADSGLDYLFGTNKWMDGSKDQIDEVKLKLNSTLKLLGEYQGYDLITKKSIGEHLSLYTFMVRYDRQALRFSILFYKPNDQWRLMNFAYDDKLGNELEEAAKAYRLKENIDR